MIYALIYLLNYLKLNCFVGENLNTVISHCHFFKSIGSTSDSMLEATFAEHWADFDKPQAVAYITPGEMAEFIVSHPNLAGITSYYAVLPLPEIPSVNILPALFLRHPTIHYHKYGHN